MKLVESPNSGSVYFRLNLDLDLNLADPFLAPLLSRLFGSNSVNWYLYVVKQKQAKINKKINKNKSVA